MASSLDGPRLGPASGTAKRLVVFLHGYGADGNDLIGFGRQWQSLLPDAAFAAPNAPERCAAGGPGYQWFALSRIDPQETFRGAQGEASRLKVFLDAELARHGLGPEALALVGFSQGTMMALHVGLRRAVAPAAIIGFSGLLAGPEALPPLEAGVPPVFLAHGEADPVVPVMALFQAAITLGAAGLPVQWHMTPGLEHGIGPDGLELAGAFLALAFAGRLAPAQPVRCRYLA